MTAVAHSGVLTFDAVVLVYFFLQSVFDVAVERGDMVS